MQEILVLDINEDGNKVSKQVSVAVSPDQFSNNSNNYNFLIMKSQSK